MLVTKQHYMELVGSAARAQQEARTLSEQNGILRTNLDWFRLRITQLEKERAQLMYSISGIKVPTPEFVTNTPDVGDILAAAPSFEDVGEKEAERLGISHQDDGTLVYKD